MGDAPARTPSFPLPQPTISRDGWQVDTHGRIYVRRLGAQDKPEEGYGYTPMGPLKRRPVVTTVIEGQPSLALPYTIEPYEPNPLWYYHSRLEVIFIPSWARKPLPKDIEGTSRSWDIPLPEEGFPTAARRYYHIFVSTTS